MHIKKYTAGGASQIVKHCKRSRGEGARYGNEAIDPERSFLNENLSAIYDFEGERIKIRDFGDTVKFWKKQTETINGKSMQKTANILISAVITLPEAYQPPKGADLKTWYNAERREREDAFWFSVLSFFKSNFAVFEKTESGEKISNFVYFCAHRDETAPHAHLGFVPILKETRTTTKREKDQEGNIKERQICSKKGTICASEVINRSVLKGLHQELDKHLRSRLPWYEGGILLSEEERQKKGQDLNYKDLKKMPEAFRDERALANRLESLLKKLGEMKQGDDLTACKEELKALYSEEALPPEIRIIRQLMIDKKLTKADLERNKTYKKAFDAYVEYTQIIIKIRKKINSIQRGGRDPEL